MPSYKFIGWVNFRNTNHKVLEFVYRSFRPDFTLIRQNPKNAGENYMDTILALQLGSVHSINSLNAIYNFQVIMIKGQGGLDITKMVALY